MKATTRARIRSVVMTVLIVGGGSWLAWWILSTGPEQGKVERPKSVPAVEVESLTATERGVVIEAWGTVQAARRVALSAEVEGPVVEIHPNLVLGATLEPDTLLFEIDPALYRVAVRRARAGVDSAEAELELESGERTVAEWEYELFQEVAGDERELPIPRSPDLVLREPQRKRAKARVDTARAELARARVLLDRTRVDVPFRAFVEEESLEIGRHVSVGEPLVTLVGVDEFWAIVTMPVDRAARLDDAEGATVRVELTTRLGEQLAREGTLVRRLPDVESEGKMARALVSIADPLGLESDLPALPLGSFVRATIDAGSLDSSYEIPREAMRENGQIWVRDSAGHLQFRDVAPVWRTEDSIFVTGEIEDGDELVTSYLADPLPGMDVRIRESK